MQQEETVIKTLTLIEEDNIEQHQTENWYKTAYKL
jgi:hypothetical protein